jgi:hypothetical protein
LVGCFRFSGTGTSRKEARKPCSHSVFGKPFLYTGKMYRLQERYKFVYCPLCFFRLKTIFRGNGAGLF